MARNPKRPPTRRNERTYLITALIIVVVASVAYFAVRQFTPEPADDATHGGPAPEASAPPAIAPSLPENGNGQELREMRPDALTPGGETEPQATPPAGQPQPGDQPQPLGD